MNKPIDGQDAYPEPITAEFVSPSLVKESAESCYTRAAQEQLRAEQAEQELAKLIAAIRMNVFFNPGETDAEGIERTCVELRESVVQAQRERDAARRDRDAARAQVQRLREALSPLCSTEGVSDRVGKCAVGFVNGDTYQQWMKLQRAGRDALCEREPHGETETKP